MGPTPLPLAAIICPREFTFSDPAATVERGVLDGVAEVWTITLAFDEPLPAAAQAADVLLLWHNIPITADVIARLQNCRALIRIGTGYDSVDTAAALRAKAFGFRVFYHDLYLPHSARKAREVERVDTLDELLDQADVLSIHRPLNDETRSLTGPREIMRLKPSARLVNTARGDIVQKAAALSALHAGRLAGAGLDVVENKPLQTADEAATPSLIVTCHAAFCCPEGIIEMQTGSAQIARAAILGQPVWNRVN